MATASLLAASVTLRPQIQVRCAKPSQVHHGLKTSIYKMNSLCLSSCAWAVWNNLYPNHNV